MRFGKTISALELVKQMNFKKTIIATHKPVVNEGWFDEFNKVFYELDSNYKYLSKTNGDSLLDLGSDDKCVYFASLQDLRGSEIVGGKYNKNNDVFSTKWDFVIIDEAHEGTQTDLGEDVIDKLVHSTKRTKTLFLSGTPFNLFEKLKTYNDQFFTEKNVYSWTYVDEQKAKLEWFKNHPLDNNPYADLPKLNIFTYDLNKDLNKKYLDTDEAFSFKEFFKVKTKKNSEIYKHQVSNFDNILEGSFIHEKDVLNFLDLLVTHSNYPYTREYKNIFRHTLWMLPGVKEAKALSKLLKEHWYFNQYNIVNVAGDGDEEERFENALKKVKDAITKNPDETKTITLSCGRLTTGVTVKPWNAVLMLSGSTNTSAIGYLQTIFRVQSPFTFNGKVKENCYVFDFAPDRTLKVITEAITSSNIGSDAFKDKEIISEFINFCPIISIEGSEMKAHNVDTMMSTIKKIIINRVVEKGFDCPELYSKERLFYLTDEEKKLILQVDNIIKPSKNDLPTEYKLNDKGFDEQIDLISSSDNEKIKKEHITKEEKNHRLEEARKARIILRAVAIRCPLLLYGMDKDITEEISIDDFTSIIDDKSWLEFMPKGFTKEMFNQIKEFFDPVVFIQAGLKIRKDAKECDNEPTTERIVALNELISNFKNPDKETVLTPWKVVNTHMGETLGGANFYDKTYNSLIKIDDNTSTRWINKDFTNEVFNTESKILEINSKTGLYPLYCAYSIYQNNIINGYSKDISNLWKDIIENNIFVICRTKMAMQITKRTLIGYRKDIKPNIIVIDDIVKKLKEKHDNNFKNIINEIYEKIILNFKGDVDMKFNAIVGNPPYQLNDGAGGKGSSATPIYHLFVELAMQINPRFISLIMPERFTCGGRGLDSFRKTFLSDTHIKTFVSYANSKVCFPTNDIKGGICYFLWDKEYNGMADHYLYDLNNKLIYSKRFLKNEDTHIFVRDKILMNIIEKTKSSIYVESIVSSQKPYGLRSDAIYNPEKYGLAPFSDIKIKDGYRVLGLSKDNKKDKRTYKYISKDYKLPKVSINLHKYKVFIAKAYGCGAIGEAISTPGDLCTETFLEIGPFNTNEEASNMIKYIHTKFFRCLVGVVKTTQNTSKSTYKYVPLQDLTSNSDVKWNNTIEEIDKYLFKKYNLNEEEIKFINEKISYIK